MAVFAAQLLISYWLLSRDGDIIYVEEKSHESFIRKTLPQIQIQIIVVSHEGNLPRYTYTTELQASDKLYMWFSRDPQLPHPKVIQIPLGITPYLADRIHHFKDLR